MDTTKTPALRHLPNCITVLRLIATAGLLFLAPFEMAFYVVYTLAGVSDVMDGWTARRLKVSSDFGAKLDSAADLIFYSVMFARIFPALWAGLPRIIWRGVQLVVALRIVTYAFAAVKFRRFAALHTYMNKATGAAVFALPYLAHLPALTPFCWGLFALSLTGALEELTIHIRAREYNPNHKSLLMTTA